MRIPPSGTLRAAPLATEEDVVTYATDALAAQGLRAPESLTDGSFAKQVAETGEYTCDVDWAYVRVRRAE